MSAVARGWTCFCFMSLCAQHSEPPDVFRGIVHDRDVCVICMRVQQSGAEPVVCWLKAVSGADEEDLGPPQASPTSFREPWKGQAHESAHCVVVVHIFFKKNRCSTCIFCLVGEYVSSKDVQGTARIVTPIVPQGTLAYCHTFFSGCHHGFCEAALRCCKAC